MEVKPVKVLGCPVGNCWDVFRGDKRIARVTFHGNKLVSIQKFQNVFPHSINFFLGDSIPLKRKNVREKNGSRINGIEKSVGLKLRKNHPRKDTEVMSHDS